MAMTSGFVMDDRDNIYFKYEYILNSQNIENNTSNITVNIYVYKTTDIETYGSGTVYCKLNDSVTSTSITSSQKFTTTPVKVLSRTQNVSHDSDGSKELVIQAKFTHSRFNSDYSSSKQYKWTLPTIPRASSFSSVTFSETSGNTSCGTLSFTINTASSSFRHQVVYSMNGFVTNLLLTSSSATSVTYQVPLAHIPNSTSGTATLTLATYSGSTKIGTTSKTVKVTVHSSVVPSIDKVEITNVKLTTTDFGFVQGYSKAKVTITASGIGGATIKSYSTVCTSLGVNGTANPYTTPTITGYGTFVFIIKVIDSRGRSSQTQKSISVQRYLKPIINTLTAIRCTSDGTSSDNGTYIRATCNFSGSTSISGNTLSAVLSYKKSTVTSYTTQGTYTGGFSTSAFGGGNIDTDSTYDVRVVVTDKIGNSTTKIVKVNSEYSVIDISESGRGIAFGKSSELENYIEMAFPVKCFGDLNVGGVGLMSAVSKATNGWFKLPNGMILQWGSSSITPTSANINTQATITYPIQFPTYTRALSILPYTSGANSTWLSYNGWKDSDSKLGFNAVMYRTSATTCSFSWIALGD